LAGPTDVAVHGDHLVIVERSANAVRWVHLETGLIDTLAGTGAPGSSGDGGPATEARFNDLMTVAVDGAGDVFIADDHGWIRRVDAVTRRVATAVGNVDRLGHGPFATARLVNPLGLAPLP